MRLDHIAYRVANRKRTARFFMESFGYRIQTEFTIDFDDGSKADCLALEPPEKNLEGAPWNHVLVGESQTTTYHLAPEIFVSDGTPESIVGKWVSARGGVGGIHHLAYQVESVRETMALWREKGYAEFTTQDPLTCPGLTQCFTKPSELTGVIYEFIERGLHGFCKDNVKSLMQSTSALR